MIVGGIALAVAALVVGEPKRIWMAALGAAIPLALIGAIHRGANWRRGQDVALGFGDVVLAPLLGPYFGGLDPAIVAPGLFFGFIFGTLGAIPALLAKKADSKSMLPFGLFLALGTIVAVFVGQRFVNLILGR